MVKAAYRLHQLWLTDWAGISDWKQVCNRTIEKLLGSSYPMIRTTHLNTYKPLSGDSVVCKLMAVWAAINCTGECGRTSAYSNYRYLVVLIRGCGSFTVQGYRLFISKRLQ